MSTHKRFLGHDDIQARRSAWPVHMRSGITTPTLTKVTGHYPWKTHYTAQSGGVVFVVTRMDFEAPIRSTCWFVECSRPAILRGHGIVRRGAMECDTLAEAREIIRVIAAEIAAGEHDAALPWRRTV